VPAHEPFTYTINGKDPSHAVVFGVGELDLSGADELRNAVLVLVGAYPTVTIDFTGLTFLDSSGINVLVVAHKTALDRGSRFEIRGATGIVARALEIVGVDQVLNIAPPPP